MQQAALPLLVLVSGPPASGKTTLATILAERYARPLFAKDMFKEMMYDNTGELPSLEMARMMGKCSIDTLQIISRQLLAQSISHILEANFDATLFTPVLRALAQDTPFRCVQVQMQCDGAVLTERFIHRAATGGVHPGHQALQYIDVLRETLAKGRGEVCDIPSDIVWIDTTDLTRVDYTPVFRAIEAVRF